MLEYLVVWADQNARASNDRMALEQWSRAVSKEEFIGKVRGLGPRAYEQILWYVNGEDSIKIDRHVVKFVGETLQRSFTENEIEAAFAKSCAVYANQRDRSRCTNLGLHAITTHNEKMLLPHSRTPGKQDLRAR